MRPNFKIAIIAARYPSKSSVRPRLLCISRPRTIPTSIRATAVYITGCTQIPPERGQTFISVLTLPILSWPLNRENSLLYFSSSLRETKIVKKKEKKNNSPSTHQLTPTPRTRGFCITPKARWSGYISNENIRVSNVGRSRVPRNTEIEMEIKKEKSRGTATRLKRWRSVRATAAQCETGRNCYEATCISRGHYSSFKWISVPRSSPPLVSVVRRWGGVYQASATSTRLMVCHNVQQRQRLSGDERPHDFILSARVQHIQN